MGAFSLIVVINLLNRLSWLEWTSIHIGQQCLLFLPLVGAVLETPLICRIFLLNEGRIFGIEHKIVKSDWSENVSNSTIKEGIGRREANQ